MRKELRAKFDLVLVYGVFRDEGVVCSWCVSDGFYQLNIARGTVCSECCRNVAVGGRANEGWDDTQRVGVHALGMSVREGR